jgi:hypothetical protein
MEDHLDKLLYLAVGVVYLFLNNAKGRHAEKQTVADEASGSRPTPEANANWPSFPSLPEENNHHHNHGCRPRKWPPTATYEVQF